MLHHTLVSLTFCVSLKSPLRHTGPPSAPLFRPFKFPFPPSLFSLGLFLFRSSPLHVFVSVWKLFFRHELWRFLHHPPPNPFLVVSAFLFKNCARSNCNSTHYMVFQSVFDPSLLESARVHPTPFFIQALGLDVHGLLGSFRPVSLRLLVWVSFSFLGLIFAFNHHNLTMLVLYFSICPGFFLCFGSFRFLLTSPFPTMPFSWGTTCPDDVLFWYFRSKGKSLFLRLWRRSLFGLLGPFQDLPSLLRPPYWKPFAFLASFFPDRPVFFDSGDRWVRHWQTEIAVPKSSV